MNELKISKETSSQSLEDSQDSLSSQSKQSSSPAPEERDIVFWIRSEIFEFGLLPLPPRSKITFANLLEVVKKYRYEHELNAKYYKAINTLYPTELNKENVKISYKEWETIATENLGLNEIQIQTYYRRFIVLKLLYVGSNKPPKDEVNEKPAINFYEFIVYLFCQLYSKSSLSNSYERGIEWPSLSLLNEIEGIQEPYDDTSHRDMLETDTLRQKTISVHRTCLVKQFNFMKENIGLLLRLLSADEPQNTIKRNELKPLKFLFACGVNFFSMYTSPFVDFLPKYNKRKRYGRIELGEWIIHKLRINTHVYLLDSTLNGETTKSSRGASIKKVYLCKPIRILNAHNKTLLRTDPASLPQDTLNTPLKNNEEVDPNFAYLYNCSYCYIYLLCPLFHVKIDSCNSCTIVLGAVSGIISVEKCKNVTIIAACQSIQIVNCDGSTFYLFTSRSPLLIGSNHGLVFGPYNTHYKSLQRHIHDARLDTRKNRWNQPIVYVLEILKNKQTIPSRAAMRMAPQRLERQTYVTIKPDNFVPFRIPFELQGQTKQIPFELENDYQLALEEHSEDVINVKKVLDKIKDKKLQAKVQESIKEKFETWLAETGEIQQIEDLLSLQME